jgi:hypothetical protein
MSDLGGPNVPIPAQFDAACRNRYLQEMTETRQMVVFFVNVENRP